ncbi:MAG: hypothetical protein WCT27_00750 [Patescibacteria group bacterium]
MEIMAIGLLMMALSFLPFNKGISNLIICLDLLFCMVCITGLQVYLIIIVMRLRRQDRAIRQNHRSQFHPD